MVTVFSEPILVWGGVGFEGEHMARESSSLVKIIDSCGFCSESSESIIIIGWFLKFYA